MNCIIRHNNFLINIIIYVMSDYVYVYAYAGCAYVAYAMAMGL